ncbi:MAG: cell division protein ZapA, partial [Acidobacteriaceae bacterium]
EILRHQGATMNETDSQRHFPDSGPEELNPTGHDESRPLETEDTARTEIAQDDSSCNLVVDIYDQIYHLRGPDPRYLEQLSALVDAKMRAVAKHGTTVDSLRVAVLAALNIADELVSLRQQRDALSGNIALNIKSRTETLAEMLDAVLEESRKAG